MVVDIDNMTVMEYNGLIRKRAEILEEKKGLMRQEESEISKLLSRNHQNDEKIIQPYSLFGIYLQENLKELIGDKQIIRIPYTDDSQRQFRIVKPKEGDIGFIPYQQRSNWYHREVPPIFSEYRNNEIWGGIMPAIISQEDIDFFTKAHEELYTEICQAFIDDVEVSQRDSRYIYGEKQDRYSLPYGLKEMYVYYDSICRYRLEKPEVNSRDKEIRLFLEKAYYKLDIKTGACYYEERSLIADGNFNEYARVIDTVVQKLQKFKQDINRIHSEFINKILSNKKYGLVILSRAI